MSEDDFTPIQPRSVPLSHVEPAKVQRPGRTRRTLPWPLLILGTVGVLVITLVFVVVPKLVGEPTVQVTHHPAAPAGAEPDRSAAATDEQLPPFQTLLREQTREKAQAELSRFVELQLKLEESMQVGQWGEEAFGEAKALATRGDEQFVAEAFESSLESYRAASDALAALIEEGERRLQTALESGAAALAERDQEGALASFGTALTIDPENPAAADGVRRAELLPEVIDLLREAKNQELAGEFRSALATYERVQNLDPDTTGLAAAMAAARSGVADTRYREHLSSGFRAMDAEEFEDARRAFNAALALKHDDAVALGGLEQVAERKDLATIRQLRSSAEGHEAAENWRQAIEDYERVLALDGNIQFAKAGRGRAEQQERIAITLGNIIASPDKLSSKSLYGQATDILASAERLEPRGPRLASQIGRVRDLLETYGTPVPVTLRSDNRTEVTLSTVGRLGTFEEKQLSLRPGAYTIIGSRDGCRDVRESILVRPDMQPVEIRCQETF